MFRRLQQADDHVRIYFDEREVIAPSGSSVAGALLQAGADPFRTTPVSGSPRQPYCMMGVCFECLLVIDGRPNQQACMTHVRDGMRITTQAGAAEIAAETMPNRG